MGKSENSGFSETITACDLKFGRSRHLIEFMKACVQGHYLTLVKGCVQTKIQIGFSQKLLCLSEPYFVCKLSGTRK